MPFKGFLGILGAVEYVGAATVFTVLLCLLTALLEGCVVQPAFFRGPRVEEPAR